MVKDAESLMRCRAERTRLDVQFVVESEKSLSASQLVYLNLRRAQMSRDMRDERLTHGELHGKPRWFLDGIPVSRKDRRAYCKRVLRERSKARRSS